MSYQLPVRGSSTPRTGVFNPYFIAHLQAFAPESEYDGLAEYDATLAIAGVPNSDITISKIRLYQAKDGSRGISMYAHKVFTKGEDGKAARDPQTGKCYKPENQYIVSLTEGTRTMLRDNVLAHFAAIESGIDPEAIEMPQPEAATAELDTDGNPIVDPFDE